MLDAVEIGFGVQQRSNFTAQRDDRKPRRDDGAHPTAGDDQLRCCLSTRAIGGRNLARLPRHIAADVPVQRRFVRLRDRFGHARVGRCVDYAGGE
jgi:hypothetical protein